MKGFGNARYWAQHEVADLRCGRFFNGIDSRKGDDISLFYPKLKTNFTAEGVLKAIRPTIAQNLPLRDTPYCALRDADLDDQGEVFLIIDRPEGQPLSTLLREQQHLDLNLALSLMIQLCELLKRGHEHQIFTATLTLNNLIVQPRPNGVSRLYLIDLGLDRRPLSEAVCSPPRELLSPPHSSLTQERDRRHFTVYLCSVLLHHLVFGVAPDSPVSSHNRVWPTLPQKGKQLDPKLEACLHTILLKGLAVHPQQRFPRMGALQRALLGLRQLTSMSAPAFELLNSTQRRLGHRSPQLNLSAPRPGVEKAVEARQRIHQILDEEHPNLTLKDLMSDQSLFKL